VPDGEISTHAEIFGAFFLRVAREKIFLRVSCGQVPLHFAWTEKFRRAGKFFGAFILVLRPRKEISASHAAKFHGIHT
jgi:hypothetical protein